MHKAIAVMQFKVEGQIIRRHPEYQMNHRRLLEKINFENGTVEVEKKTYEMLDMAFPTVDHKDPLKLTAEEEELLHTLQLSFKHSQLLHKHVRFLYSNGGMYKSYNQNLLYHGCIPMKKDGSFDEIEFSGIRYSGKSLLDFIDRMVQSAYFLSDANPDKAAARDFMWYLWCGEKSPVYGKDKMTTFEHYFIGDKSTYKEVMNPYYQLSVREEYCHKILKEFGLPTDHSRIINGHVPVKIKDGETPIKAGGKLYIIDGGLSKAYQGKTGIAGYTLIYNSRHLALAEHKPFCPGKENTPKVTIVEKMEKRIMVGDTDLGAELTEKINDLKELVTAYREGIIKEKIL
jgi:fructose-1,6-bisphosphatase-3